MLQLNETNYYICTAKSWNMHWYKKNEIHYLEGLLF